MQNRKNLFVQINIPQQTNHIQQLANNWTKPIPQEFHLINSPTLNFHLSTFNPNSTTPKIQDFFDEKIKQKVKLPKRNKQRQKYRKLKEQINFLQDFLKDFKQLQQSQLLAYKQTILVRYLSSIVGQISNECHQKGQFVKHIWNTLIKIFEELFSRVINQSKTKEKKFLQQQIDMHNCYQQKMKEMGLQNRELQKSDSKYQEVIREITSNVSIISQEAKAMKTLYDRSIVTVKELTQKYEQIKCEYLDLLMNGSPGNLTRAEAESLIHDKETLLFAKQITHIDASIKLKQKKQRKARIIDNNIDVNMLLQEIQAQEYSFEIECQQKKTIKYQNQKVQTYSNGMNQKQNIGVQCGYLSRMEVYQIKDKSAQTNKEQIIYKLDQRVQTAFSIESQQKFDIYQVFSLELAPKCLNLYSIKKLMSSQKSMNKQNEESKQDFTGESQFNIQQSQNNLKERQSNLEQKRQQQEQLQNIIKIAPKRRDSKIQRDSKMFKVGDFGTSNRGSRMYLQRMLKTQSNNYKIQPSKSLIKNQSKDKRMSQYLILQNIRQSTIKNISKFKKNRWENRTITEKLRQNILQTYLINGDSIRTTIQTVMIQRDFANRYSRSDINYYQNLHLCQANSHIQQLYNKQQAILVNRKIVTTAIHAKKCIKIVNEVFKMARKFINLGYHSINLVTLTQDYLSALEGRVLSTQIKQKKLIQFFRSCSLISFENFLIRNYFILCGIHIQSKDEKVLKLSKIQMDGHNRKSDMQKILRSSKGQFNFMNRAKQQQAQNNLSRYIYSSQVKFYFDFLYLINMSQNKDDINKFYTTFQKFLECLPLIKNYYKNNQELLSQIMQAMNITIQEYKGQSDVKLNIFKCLHMILEKILTHKCKIIVEYYPLVKYHNSDLTQQLNSQFVHQIIPLLDINYTEGIILLQILNQNYKGGKSIQDLVTAFMIEGLDINLNSFVAVEKQHKFNILRRIFMNKSNISPMFNNMIENISNKSLKKHQFYILLKYLWEKQCSNILEDIMGDNLSTLYTATLPTKLPKSTIQNYHNQLHKSFQETE